MPERIYDAVAIGLGPFNLGLACLAEPLPDLDLLVLDENPDFDWHPGLMFEDAHLQTPFLSDLVTLADPTSPYSFLNYIKQQGRIYSFYVRKDFFLLRREYNQYCQWAAANLSNLAFNRRVEAVTYDEPAQFYRIQTHSPETGTWREYRARRLVLGTGPSPYMPACAEGLRGEIVHASDYLYRKPQLQKKHGLTVVGSGQSAAEIVYDLLRDIDHHAYSLTWFTRSPRFWPLEYTKLTLEMTSPDYVDYFHALEPEVRDGLVAGQKQLYKGIDGGLINAIHDLLYTKRLSGQLPVRLMTNTRLVDAQNTDEDGLRLQLRQQEQARDFELHCDGLILATGYQYQPPTFLEGIAERIRWDAQGRFAVNRNYSIDHDGDGIFVQNAELHTHGFVAPDLGMACYRNASILRELTGRDPYPIEERVTFQEFGAPEQTAALAYGIRA